MHTSSNCLNIFFFVIYSFNVIIGQLFNTEYLEVKVTGKCINVYICKPCCIFMCINITMLKFNWTIDKSLVDQEYTDINIIQVQTGKNCNLRQEKKKQHN
jgi:hypothetical protein